MNFILNLKAASRWGLCQDEIRERELWQRACLRVLRGARRRGDLSLVFFAGNVGYGCQLVKVS